MAVIELKSWFLPVKFFQVKGCKMSISVLFPINDGLREFKFQAYKGDIKSISVDFSAWAEQNGTVTSADWSIEAGNGSIGTEDLANNVAEAPFTFSDSGVVTISVVANSATARETALIKALVKELDDGCADDYE